MLLRVNMPAGTFVADVGFGGKGPVHPLPLEDGASVRCGPFAHRLRCEDQLWVLQSATPDGWIDLYSFTLEPQYPVDFEMANHYVSTHPRSAFRLTLTVQRSWLERRAVLRDRELTVSTGDGDAVSTIRDAEHLLEVLATEFALAFPPGTRFSQPAF